MKNELFHSVRAPLHGAKLTSKSLESPKTKMILIADDNDDVRRMIRSLIEEIDADVIEASDGGAAIEAFELNRPAWVLMDINMHPVDGLTAMRTILEKQPDAQIVIVSQHQDARTRETALAMGAHAFVGKEDLMALRDLIREEVGEHIAVCIDQ